MLLPGAVHRVVCSSLELRQALLLNMMPSHMTALALGNGRMSKRKKGSFWLLISEAPVYHYLALWLLGHQVMT